MVIRRALPGEAKRLSELAMRSKAHWGYDEQFLERVRPILTFTEEDVLNWPMYVMATESDEPAGVYRITGAPPEGELEDLWLDPPFIGRGLGLRSSRSPRSSCSSAATRSQMPWPRPRSPSRSRHSLAPTDPVNANPNLPKSKGDRR